MQQSQFRKRKLTSAIAAAGSSLSCLETGKRCKTTTATTPMSPFHLASFYSGHNTPNLSTSSAAAAAALFHTLPTIGSGGASFFSAGLPLTSFFSNGFKVQAQSFNENREKLMKLHHQQQQYKPNNVRK